MSDKPRFEFITHIAPYSDGSGYQATVKVMDTDEGPALSIETAYRLPLNQWASLRKAVDDLVELAEKHEQ
jgi:hypothetical protein